MLTLQRLIGMKLRPTFQFRNKKDEVTRNWFEVPDDMELVDFLFEFYNWEKRLCVTLNGHSIGDNFKTQLNLNEHHYNSLTFTDNQNLINGFLEWHCYEKTVKWISVDEKRSLKMRPKSKKRRPNSLLKWR